MGNKQSQAFDWEKQFNILQRNFNDNTLVVQKKGSNHQYLARQMMSSDKKQSNQIKRLIHIKTHGHNPFLTKLVQFYYNNDAAYCSPEDKIYLVFEKPKQTLRQQILARKFANQAFSEEQADVILQSGAKAIRSLKQANHPHNNISTSSIFIDNDRKILLGDPWITPPIYNQDINQNAFACPSPQKILFQNDQILTICPYRADLFSLGTVVLEALNFEHMDVLYQKGFRKLIKSKVEERLSKIKDQRLRYKLSVVLSHDPQNREQIYNVYRTGSTNAQTKNKAINRQTMVLKQEDKTNNSTLNFKKKLTRINSTTQVIKQAQIIEKPMGYPKVGNNQNQFNNTYNPVFNPSSTNQFNFMKNQPNQPNYPPPLTHPYPYYRPNNTQNYSQIMNMTNPATNFTYNNIPNHNVNYGNFGNNKNFSTATDIKINSMMEGTKLNSKFDSVYKPDMAKKTVSNMNLNTTYTTNINNNISNTKPSFSNQNKVPSSYYHNQKPFNINNFPNYSPNPSPINSGFPELNAINNASNNTTNLNLVNVNNLSNRKSAEVQAARYSEGLQNKLYKTQKVSTEVTQNNFQPVMIKSGNDFVNLSANIRFVESSSLQKSKSADNHQSDNVQHVGNYGVKNISDFVAVKTPVQSFQLNPKQQIYQSNIHRKSVSDSSDKIFLDAITDKPNQIANYMTQSKETPERRPTRKYNSTIKQQPDENSYSGSRDGDDDYEYVVEEYDAGRYEGQRKNGMRNGYGKFHYIEGSVYQGQWKDNTMHGKGNLYYSNGRLAYEGDWRMDQFHGYGKVYNQDQVPIQGSFDYRDFSDVNDYWASYEGQLNSDRRHGRGKIKFSNGQIFSGNFALDIVEGEGKFYKLNGQIIHGIWSKNKLVKKL